MDNRCVMNRTMLPVNYPSSQHKDSPLPPKDREVINTTFLLLVKLSFKWLVQGCEYCFHNFFHKSWSKQEAVVYMKNFNVQDSYSNELIISKTEKLMSMNSNQEYILGEEAICVHMTKSHGVLTISHTYVYLDTYLLGY